MQPAFGEHANVYLHCDDSNSDESDYEDNIPLTVVQEGLNPMSVVSPICSRTRNTQHHDSVSQYDWVKLNRKFSNCATWNRLEATVKNEMDQLPSLPDCFAGDIAVDRDQVQGKIFQVTYYKGLMSTIPYALCLMEIASVGLLAI